MKAPLTKAIVVGASSGIGEAIAIQLAESGAEVAILARRADELARVASRSPDRLHPYPHDVTDFDAVPALLDRIVKDLGGLDTFVYATGVLERTAEGEYAFEKDRRMITVNVLGAFAWLNLVAVRFEAAHAGTIIGISSIAGERGRRMNPAYGASKACLTSYLESLRNRCARRGVNVVTVKPGFVATAMTQGMKNLPWVVPPEAIARRTLSLARRGTGASGFAPWRWTVVASIVRALPSRIFRRMNF